MCMEVGKITDLLVEKKEDEETTPHWCAASVLCHVLSTLCLLITSPTLPEH